MQLINSFSKLPISEEYHIKSCKLVLYLPIYVNNKSWLRNILMFSSYNNVTLGGSPLFQTVQIFFLFFFWAYNKKKGLKPKFFILKELNGANYKALGDFQIYLLGS